MSSEPSTRPTAAACSRCGVVVPVLVAAAGAWHVHCPRCHRLLGEWGEASQLIYPPRDTR